MTGQGDTTDPTKCPWCGEPIEPGDKLAPGFVGQRVHYECGLRSVLGGVNHLAKRCSCFSGTEPPDPPGMPPREAAREAVRYWMLAAPRRLSEL